MLTRCVSALAMVFGISVAVMNCPAQTAVLDLPRDSQHSVVTQRIGISDIHQLSPASGQRPDYLG